MKKIVISIACVVLLAAGCGSKTPQPTQQPKTNTQSSSNQQNTSMNNDPSSQIVEILYGKVQVAINNKDYNAYKNLFVDVKTTQEDFIKQNEFLKQSYVDLSKMHFIKVEQMGDKVFYFTYWETPEETKYVAMEGIICQITSEGPKILIIKEATLPKPDEETKRKNITIEMGNMIAEVTGEGRVQKIEDPYAKDGGSEKAVETKPSATSTPIVKNDDALTVRIIGLLADNGILDSYQYQELVKRQIVKAQSYGFETDEQLTLYVMFAIKFGEDFDIKYPELNKVLVDGGSANNKAQSLYYWFTENQKAKK